MKESAATQGNGVRARCAEQMALSAVIRRIIIVGAGGFGREVLGWARDAWPDLSPKIAGFLSADAACRVPLPILCDPAEFRPEPGDGLLLAIGIPSVRRRVAEAMAALNANFLTLVHPSAVVASSAVIGTGAILCPYTVVSDSAHVGRFALLNYHSSLGHDASTGDYSVLSPYATLGGGARVCDDVFIGLHGSVGPGKTVGPRSKVSANSCVLTDAPPDSLIFGVPGRIVPGIASTPHR